MKTKSERTVQWPISKLKHNPKQAEFFGSIGEALLQDLKANMTRFGQRTPIEIAADGTIIDGHQRVEAARQLGWTEIDVMVVDGTPAELEERFITANATRRQLSPLQRARCAKALMEIEKGKPKRRYDEEKQRGQLRDRIGALLHISGREVDRLLSVLKTPQSVQNAYEAGKISIDLAGKVAKLSEQQREQLDEQIRSDGNLDNARQIIEQFMGSAKADPDQITGAYQRYLDVVDRRARELAPQIESIDMDPVRVAGTIEILTRANALNAELLKRARNVQRAGERRKQKSEQDLAELCNTMRQCA